jgi:predicted RNA-binding protein with TRAM domain
MEEFGGRRGGFGRGRFDRGRGDSRNQDFGEKPVNVGEEYDVEIESVAEKGDGVAKIKGLIVFVPGAQKGDKLKIRIKELKRKCAIAEKVGEGSVVATDEGSAAAEPAEELVPEAATEDEVTESEAEASEDGQEEEEY